MFLVLAVLVAVGALDAADRAILEAVRTPQADWLDLVGSVVSVLGRSEVIASVVLGVAIARLRARRRDWWVPLAVVAVVAIEVACKLLIPQEPPPKELARGVEIGPFLRSPFLFGFPSGHVARVAFVVFALRWPLPLALAVMLLVALTRVYSAHHWPSDVMAGWLLGYAVATIARRA